MYRPVYRLHSLVHLLQPTGYRVYRLVLATQPCTLASTYWLQSVPTGTGYTALYTCFNNCLQSVPTGTGYTALYTCFNSWLRVYRPVLATQPSTLASTAGYRVYRLVLATQPCTLASTYWLQNLLTGCWLHSPYCTVLHPNWLHKKKKKSWLNIDQ